MDGGIVKPAVLQGFLELLPQDQLLFNGMMDKIRGTYEKFGFIPLDTPSIEKAEILLAKSGGETEKQIYRFSKGDTDMALRFDLTVPLARYAAQHYSELCFPFKRYAIGKVYRGERPQKGRFREFYQCDVDVVGSESLDIAYEAEMIAIIYSTIKALGFDDFVVSVNNRKILKGYFEYMGIKHPDEAMRLVDKIRKIGEEALASELAGIGVDSANTAGLIRFLNIGGRNCDIIREIKNYGIDNPLFLQGVAEIEKVLEYASCFDIPDRNCKVDLTIARGLDYYTGTVYETYLDSYPEIGSICSGGRYDNLAQNFIDRKLPGVGVSIGLSRLFWQFREAGITGAGRRSSPAVLLVIPMADTVGQATSIAAKLRENGIPAEVNYSDGKLGKKFQYADRLGIPYAVVVGADEIESGKFRLKDMTTGSQVELELDGIVRILSGSVSEKKLSGSVNGKKLSNSACGQ